MLPTPSASESAGTAPTAAAYPPTPILWRIWIALGVAGVALIAYFLFSRGILTPRGRAGYGVVCILGAMTLFSASLRAVNWRAVILGFVLQFLLAVLVLKLAIPYRDGDGVERLYQPGMEFFGWLGGLIAQFLKFADAGAQFVFGPLVNDDLMRGAFGRDNAFVFAFKALPTIIFVSSFFTVLYHFGILQFVVRIFARAMIRLMGTSGAETLSAAANVFMGQTEAPLIVKPYVAHMTQSELLALMAGGMATISGSLMAVYIGFGADPVALLTTSVMAAPTSLFLAKLVLPELERPETTGQITAEVPSQYRNAVDAAAGGASDGLFLALNVAGMLIAFIAFVELVNVALMNLPTGQPLADWLWQRDDAVLGPWGNWRTGQRFVFTVLGFLAAFLILRKLMAAAARRLGVESWLIDFRRATWLTQGLVVIASYLLFLGLLDVSFRILPERLTLASIFTELFAPLAFFMGVEDGEIDAVARLLGTKLATNEFVAYVDLSRLTLSERSRRIATFALTGFANFASIGIQLGGIGAMAPSRRADLARLGGRALLVGFMTTVLNAAIAGMLLEPERE